MKADRRYRVAVIPGDGIGKEVVPEGVRVLEAAAKKHRFTLEQTWFDFSSYDYYAKHGRMMPEDWNAQLNSPEVAAAVKFYVDTVRNHGEAGGPVVADHVERRHGIEATAHDHRARHRRRDGHLPETPCVEDRGRDDDGLACAPGNPVEHRGKGRHVGASASARTLGRSGGSRGQQHDPAGTFGQNRTQGDTRAAAGLGVLYYTGIGPIRVDLA